MKKRQKYKTPIDIIIKNKWYHLKIKFYGVISTIRKKFGLTPLVLWVPNLGKAYPTHNSIENFEYNGFGISMKKGFAPYEIKKFIEWTNDPGIGRFECTDGKERLIPSCQLSETFLLPPRPNLNPYKGKGVLFGIPSSSK